MKTLLRAHWYIASAWFVLLGGYIAVCVGLPSGADRNTAASLLLCMFPLLVNGALLVNAVTPDWRKRTFWMLLASGCVLWMVGQIVWTYVVAYQQRHVPDLFSADIVFFLHTV